jgi:hypothetical protein
VVCFVYFAVSSSSSLQACAVCFTAADPAITQSLNAGIFVLLGVTGVVLAGFAWFIVSLVRRARAATPVAPEPLA